ncbi:MAG: hypothetical protein J6B68_08215 [Lachnospiraceae bacterium]|nr:hypothetical protein [Lachnospiraceae bacterium]
MRKQLVKNILTIGIIFVMFVSNSLTVLAYTQDECIEEWKRLAEQYGINMDDYKTTGGW